MEEVVLFLEALNRRIPPDAGMHHNLTLTEQGLMLTLMIGKGRYLPVLIQEEDYTKEHESFIDEIETFVRLAL